MLNAVLPRYGMADRDIFHEFIAQVAYESAWFTSRSENMNYSAERLQEVFHKYFPTKALANQYAKNPVAIANRVYANRLGNGNEASGDGYANRGGGFIQLTGKALISLYAKHIGVGTLEASQLIRSSDYYAMDSACWYFAVERSLKAAAVRDEFTFITKSVNAASLGYKNRKEVYERAKAVLPV